MTKYINAKKFLSNVDIFIDQYGTLEITATKLNIAMEKSSVDAVEVVRCIDCKHYRPENSSCYRRCSVDKGGYILPVMPLDFCSRGERKETE